MAAYPNEALDTVLVRYMLRRYAPYDATRLTRLESVAAKRDSCFVMSSISKIQAEQWRRHLANIYFPCQYPSYRLAPYTELSVLCALVGDSHLDTNVAIPRGLVSTKGQQAVPCEPGRNIEIECNNRNNYHILTFNRHRCRTRDGGVGSSYSPELIHASLECGQDKGTEFLRFGLVSRERG